jgi:hypothetical protein
VDDLPPKLLHAPDGVEQPPGTFKSVPQLIEAANEYAKNYSRDPIVLRQVKRPALPAWEKSSVAKPR